MKSHIWDHTMGVFNIFIYLIIYILWWVGRHCSGQNELVWHYNNLTYWPSNWELTVSLKMKRHKLNRGSNSTAMRSVPTWSAQPVQSLSLRPEDKAPTTEMGLHPKEFRGCPRP